METGLSINITRLEQYNRDTKLHTSLWSRLVWLVDGDELIFIRSGYAFDTEKFMGEGWVLLFNQFFLTGFLERYPDSYNSGLVANRTTGMAAIPLTPSLKTEMNDLALLLNHAQDQKQAEMYLQSYADLILLNANHAHAKLEKQVQK
ncbi:hypothetical protein [Pedobacter africanus]|uniref:Uncharacterized protein n=1 Tax=Pedobacter africanus TaxID=151894 RepID=A0A1W2A9H0_9SPHI|nr:hypothetical protein [Pedobacter africanus]SMC57233.1 hypothetical protein SAMN04488524_1261 [Pedobacter africanus]